MVRNKRRTTKRNIMTTAIAGKRKAAGACAFESKTGFTKLGHYFKASKREGRQNV